MRFDDALTPASPVFDETDWRPSLALWWWPRPLVRCLHVLVRRGRLPRAATLADLATLTRAELRSVRGLGPTRLGCITHALDAVGLALADDATDDESTEALIEMLPTRRSRPPAARARRERA